MAELRDGAGCLILTDAAHEADARALEPAFSRPTPTVRCPMKATNSPVISEALY